VSSPPSKFDPASQTAIWQRNARQWSRIGPPLRPSADDLVALSGVLAAWQAARPGRALEAALLGVTPEIAGAPWPQGTRLVALDHSVAMIRTVWAGAAARPAAAFAVCADWRRLPISAGRFDVMAGDGAFNVLGSYADYDAVLGALRAALDPAGRLVLRFFMRPDRA
jgi:SAM-dependent methyltransferase